MTGITKTVIIITALSILSLAVYFNFYFVKEKSAFTKKTTPKKNKTKLNPVTNQSNAEINEYKDLYEDYKRLEQEINTFSSQNSYVINEQKLIHLVNEMVEAKSNFEKLIDEYESKDYISNFSEAEINRIKDLIKI